MNGLVKESAADGFQIKSLSLQRFKEKIGVLPKTIFDEIVAAVALCIGFSPPEGCANEGCASS
jgi:mRNA-degrading endonuclease toxin of MazEF toxin-antitoxin module